jgi:hypothetical protein
MKEGRRRREDDDLIMVYAGEKERKNREKGGVYGFNIL